MTGNATEFSPSYRTIIIKDQAIFLYNGNEQNEEFLCL